MDILEAAKQIEGAVRAYLSRDENGLYRIPFEMQRPIIMMGPPGVGKTAIVAQIARRAHINFVSYSITHHTRQSALGLPYIAHAEFAGKEYRVSRYTMSEIIAAVYDAIDETGVQEGILFLDEINCASQTLAPAMLQFLQYKTFGQHRLPQGWVIVSAGNPGEYNRSAREFDLAMLDRMKRIDVEPDLKVWMDYATSHRVHPAILTYLTNKPDNFYNVRAGVTHPQMVTARGWEDLSRMILAYEKEGIEVDYALVVQYIQHQEIAEDFSLYYALFSKYQDDYKVQEILAGEIDEAIEIRAAKAPFDERVALVNLLVDSVLDEVHRTAYFERACIYVRDLLKSNEQTLNETKEPIAYMSTLIAEVENKLEEVRSSSSHTKAQLQQLVKTKELLEDIRQSMAEQIVVGQQGRDNFELAKDMFNKACIAMASHISMTSKEIDNALDFLEKVYGTGQELLIFISKLTCDSNFMSYVAHHTNKKFSLACDGLMFHERGIQLLDKIKSLQDNDE